MKNFTKRSYQLRHNLKWIPKAILHEDFGNGSGDIREHPITEKNFDTQEEADKFVVEYFTKMGYTEL